MKIAVIGRGVTGQAQIGMFGEHVAVSWDMHDAEPYPFKKIAVCQMAVICVDTPMSPSPGHAADLTHFWDAIDSLPARVPILIRSTIPPGTTDQVRNDMPLNLVAHAPDFMYERPGGRWPRPQDVPFLLLGGDQEERDYFRPLIGKVFPGRIRECPALIAELAKYTVNLYWATKVTFVNEMARVSAAFGADWEDVRQAWLEDPRVTDDYTAVDGFPPGFGGKCWPKDLAALIAASEAEGYRAMFLRSVQEANRRFTA